MSVSLLLSNVTVTGSSVVYAANFSGIGGTIVLYSGQNVLISGGAGGAGDVTQAQLNSLSGFTTGISGYLQAQIAMTSGGVTSVNGASGVLNIIGSGGITVTTNGQNIIISGNNWTTSGDLQAAISGLISTGNADLRYYPLTTNPLGYITTGQTGQFYPTSNPQQYITSGNLQQSGMNLYGLITELSGQSVTDYATKVQLTNTGITIENQINSLSGWAASATNLGLTGSNLYTMLITESGALVNLIAATGQQAYNLITGASGALQAQISLNLTQAQVLSRVYCHA